MKLQKTELKKKIIIKGVEEKLDVYRIDLEDLNYNILNDRINVELNGYDLSEMNRKEVNDKIEECIWKSSIKENEKTKQSIKTTSQLEPGVVLEDGTVIDGNRRFTCLRKLYEETHNQKYRFFEAVLIENSMKLSKEQLKTLELNLQHKLESRVDYDPINRKIAVYNAINDEENKFTFKKYAFETGRKENEVKKEYEAAAMMHDFLEYIDQPNNYKILKDLQLDGPFSDMQNSKLYGDGFEEQRTDLYNFILMNKGDHKKLRTVIKAVKDKDYYEENIELFEEISDIVEEGLTGKIEDLAKLRSDIDVMEEVSSKFESITSKHEMKENTNCDDILKVIKKANVQFSVLDKDEFSMMCEHNFALKKEFDNLLKTLNELH